MFGLGMILFALLVAALGSLIRPDNTKDADQQTLQIATQKPGFTAKFIKVRKNKEIEDQHFWNLMFFGGQENAFRMIPITEYEFKGSDIVVKEYTGSEKIKGEEIPVNMADVLYAIDTDHQYIEDGQGNITFHVLNEEKKTMSLKELEQEVMASNIVEKTYYLGTDNHGRDLLSRLMSGTIVSLSVGFISVFISLLIGITLGAFAGYYRGWVDNFIMWLINVVWSIPTILLVIVMTLAIGKGFATVFIAIGLTMWVEVARVVRGQVLGVREQEFIEAGKALGFTSVRLILRHVIPNIMGPVIVISAANFASAILIEAGLSFLGIGAQPPMASWGSMVNEFRVYMTTDMAFLAILPGICIMLMVLAFMLIGNGLRDALDSKSFDDINAAG